MSYDWSNNPLKLRRAIDALPKDAPEEQIKAEYIRIGGLVSYTEFEIPTDIHIEEELKKAPDSTPKKAVKKTSKKK